MYMLLTPHRQLLIVLLASSFFLFTFENSFAAVGKSIPDNMVLVKGGCYLMGEKGFRYKKTDSSLPNFDSTPEHEVCVDDFYIGKYELTQSEWEGIMGPYSSHKNKYDSAIDNPAPWDNKKCGKNCPVENVSLDEVNEFIVKLNSKTGKNYRLATETEWEYAARARGKTRTYIGTDNESEIGDFAWTSNNTDVIQPVGTRKPNAIGLYDMSGNVSEFVIDNYRFDYTKTTKHNPKNLDNKYKHNNKEINIHYNCTRGGDYRWSNERHFRATRRDSISLEKYRKNSYTGFRLVHDVPDADISWLSKWQTKIGIPHRIQTKSGEGKLTDEGLRSIAESICGFYGRSGAYFPENFIKKVANSIKYYEGIDKPTPKQMIDFLNRNKHKMTCGSRKNKKNYMMVAFDESAHIPLFRKIFQRKFMRQDRSARIDVNVVSFTGPNGKPETLLDYIDRMLLDNKRSAGILKEATSLRRFFVKKLDAKSFKDLPAAEQAKFKR